MASKYPACEHIKRPIPDLKITNDVAEAIGRDYRTLPIFEKGLAEYNSKRYHSLETNEYLKCRWMEYKKHIEDRVYAPFQFLDIRDYHFYNCKNRLIPAESIFRKQDFRMKLRVGPGVDFRGQIPIPQDMVMKRGTQKPKEKRRSVNKEGAKLETVPTE